MSLVYKGAFVASFRIEEPYLASRERDGFTRLNTISSLRSDFSLAPRYLVAPKYSKGMNRLAPLLRDIGAGSNNEFRLGSWSGAILKESFPKIDTSLEWKVCVEFYEPHFVQVQLKYSGTQQSHKELTEFEQHSQLLGAIDAKPLPALLRAVGSLAVGRPTADLQGLGKMRRTASLSIDKPPIELARILHERRQQIIAMHIGRDATLFVDPRLIGAVRDSNARLNLKAEDRTLLVTAQGVTSVSPNLGSGTGKSRKASAYNRFGRASDLLAVADLFQHILLCAELSSDLLAGPWGGSREVIKRWVRYPASVFHASRSNLEIWKVLSDELSLGSLLDEVEAGLG